MFGVANLFSAEAREVTKPCQTATGDRSQQPTTSVTWVDKRLNIEPVPSHVGPYQVNAEPPAPIGSFQVVGALQPPAVSRAGPPSLVRWKPTGSNTRCLAIDHLPLPSEAKPKYRLALGSCCGCNKRGSVSGLLLFGRPGRLKLVSMHAEVRRVAPSA
jgi:hypothetical protein